MFKYLRALWLLLTGRFQAAAAALHENVYVMEATYDAAIEKKQATVQQVKGAVAALIAQMEKKVVRIKTLSSELTILEQVKAGAAAKAKQQVNRLINKSPEEIKQDAEVIRCQAAFTDASSTAKEKESRVKELESEVESDKIKIANYKAQLQSMQRAAEALKQEKGEAIADVQIAKDSEAINDALAGIAKDTSAQDLAAARDARQKAKARAKVAGELAGTDAKTAENEFIQFAEQTSGNKEFDALIGIERTNGQKTLEPSKLPEK